MTGYNVTPEQASERLSETYARTLKQASSFDALHRNIPLMGIAALERGLRKLFLDNEDLARQSDGFFKEYASQYPEIFTKDAQEIIRRLSSPRAPRFYITELNVPPTGSIAEHRTDIDLVSFYNAGETMRIFNCTIKPNNIIPLHAPRQKGDINHRYWATRSTTHRTENGKDEKTVIKVRKRINGTGYLLPGLSEEEINRLKGKYGEDFLACFAH